MKQKVVRDTENVPAEKLLLKNSNEIDESQREGFGKQEKQVTNIRDEGGSPTPAKDLTRIRREDCEQINANTFNLHGMENSLEKLNLQS